MLRKNNETSSPGAGGLAQNHAPTAQSQSRNVHDGGMDILAVVGPVARAVAAGFPVTSGPTPRFLVPMLDALEQRAPRRCRHLRRQHLAVFLPHKPNRLLCWPCAAVAMQRLAGTLEDYRCDACGTCCPSVRPLTVLTRGLVVVAGTCELCRLSGQVEP